MTKDCWIIVLALSLLPFAIKKELAELKIVSVTLFWSAILFVLINIVQLLARGNELQNFDIDPNYWGVPPFGDDFIAGLVIII